MVPCHAVERLEDKAEVEKAERIDATPARERINALRAAGWTVQAIADRAGYHEGTIRSISVGRWKQSSRFTVEDICSIPLTAVAA